MSFRRLTPRRAPFLHFWVRVSILILPLWLSTRPLGAQTTGTTSSGFSYSVSNGTVTITLYDGTGGAVTIPSTIAGDPVTAIGSDAFESQATITSLTVPSGVTTIGSAAFGYCGGMTSITLPSTLTTLSDEVFQGCSALTSITIPSGVTSIGSADFVFCRSLANISVDPANPDFSSLEGILFDKAQDQLIAFPEAWIGSYTIPSTVTGIADSAFQGSASLSNVTIPASVTTIGNQAFVSCSDLKTVTFLGNAPTIAANAFESDPDTVIIFPENATGYTNPFLGLPAGPLIAPIFTTQPASQTVDQSQSTTLTAVASGAPTLTYQWFLNGSPLSGATYSTLILANLQPTQSGNYTVVAANSLGATTSNVATLTVLAVPLVTGLAATGTGYVGVPFQLSPTISNAPTSVAATGLPPGLAFSLSSGSISGTPAATGVYNVAITGTNALGTGTTSAITLTIEPTPLVFSVLAGGGAGSLDGTGSAAQFNQPNGLAIDGQGNLYVADTGNSTLRKVTPAGVVTTLAGTAGKIGSTDGQGAAALFSSPTGVALDSSGNIFVTDTGNNTIRKITASGLSSTVAGAAGASGSSDGTGAQASFDAPTGITLAPSGNLYVADTGNDTVRQITPGGSVTTFAGLAQQAGDIDAFGIGARFANPTGITVDANGNVFVNDNGNFSVREISAETTVSTVAVLTPNATIVGAPLFSKTFNGITIDNAGNLYFAQGPTNIPVGLSINGILTDLFQITPGGTVSTLREWSDTESLDGPALQTTLVSGVTRDPSGSLYILANGVLEKSSLASGPTISAQPTSQTVNAGQAVTFSVTANSNPSPSYQWMLNGVAIAGATGATLTLSNVSADQAGGYSVGITTPYSYVVSNVATLSVNGTDVPRLVNISTRAQVGTGGNLLIPGFVIGGAGSETLLIRADGPALTPFGVSGVLAQPSLTVLDASGKALATNNAWGSNNNPALVAETASAVGAFALQPGSADSALIISLPAGAYTVQVSGLDNTTGVALAEIYEVSSIGTRLINISTRAQVGTGGNIIIPGFVLSGSGIEQLLVRADGPALTQFGVSGILAQPSLSVFDSSGAAVDSNTGWGTSPDPLAIASAAAEVGAFALASGSADSAAVVSVGAGAYTMPVSGVNASTGVALAEVYEIPPGS